MARDSAHARREGSARLVGAAGTSIAITAVFVPASSGGRRQTVSRSRCGLPSGERHGPWLSSAFTGVPNPRRRALRMRELAAQAARLSIRHDPFTAAGALNRDGAACVARLASFAYTDRESLTTSKPGVPRWHRSAELLVGAFGPDRAHTRQYPAHARAWSSMRQPPSALDLESGPIDGQRRSSAAPTAR